MTARLEVDLDQLASNIRTVRERMPGIELMAVVKNDAYGHGIGAVVPAAVRAGVSWFGSFDVETGARVRELAPQTRIFAWCTADEDRIGQAAACGIDLGVGDAEFLDRVLRVAALRLREAAAEPVRIHLKIDTGLHRNGFRPEAWDEAVQRAAEAERHGLIRVEGVWTHIAEVSDAADDEARTEFLIALAAAERAGLRPRLRHLAASAAGFARPEFRFDAVRVGAFCYGVRSAGGNDLPGIVPIATLLAPVTAVADDRVTVGYGAWDGLPSRLAGRMSAGTPAGPRRVRRIDETSLELEAWPGAAVGDEVALFGPGARGESDATALAEAIDTVGEEILTRVSPRVPRVYLGGSGEASASEAAGSTR